MPAATLYVRTAKRGRPRVIELDRELAIAIRDCNAISRTASPWLIPTANGGPNTAHRIQSQVAQWLRANLGPYTAHSLRHTAAMRTYAATGDVLAVMQVLGHRNLRSTLTYLSQWWPMQDPGPHWPAPHHTTPPLHLHDADHNHPIPLETSGRLTPRRHWAYALAVSEPIPFAGQLRAHETKRPGHTARDLRTYAKRGNTPGRGRGRPRKLEP